jgi:hypothetical protein
MRVIPPGAQSKAREHHRRLPLLAGTVGDDSTVTFGLW